VFGEPGSGRFIPSVLWLVVLNDRGSRYELDSSVSSQVQSPFQTFSLNSMVGFQKTGSRMSDFTYSWEYILIFWPLYIHTKSTVEWTLKQQ
jgi:hypothetical protein